MKIRICGVLICVSLVMLTTIGFTQIIQGYPCEPVVRYEPFSEESYGFNRISLEKLTSLGDVALAADSSERIFSAWKTHWFIEKKPDFMDQGPWETLLLVGSYDQPKWSIRVEDHASGGVESRWINERLLFVRVWWGRIVSTDLIIDTDTGNYMYRESANYGEFLINCPDSVGKRH